MRWLAAALIALAGVASAEGPRVVTRFTNESNEAFVFLDSAMGFRAGWIDFETGKPLAVFDGASGANCVAAYPGGHRETFCAIAKSGGTVDLYNAQGRLPYRRLYCDQLQLNCLLIADEFTVVGGATDGSIVMWSDGLRRAFRRDLPYARAITALESDVRDEPFRRYLFTGYDDGTLRIYDWRLDMETRRFHAGDSGISCLRTNTMGTRLVVGFDSGELKLLDLESGSMLRSLSGHDSRITGCRFDKADQQFVTSDEAGRVLLWSAKANMPVGEFFGNDVAVTGLDFSQSGRQLITGAADGTVRTWDVRSRSETGRFYLGE